MTTGRPVRPDFEDGYKTELIADAIVRSAQERREVDVETIGAVREKASV
ncbi:hypothetical protein [Deinococcus sp.]